MGIPSYNRKVVHGREDLTETPVLACKDSALKSMSGNGMHLSVVSCLLMCIVKHVHVGVTLQVLDD